MVSVLYTSTLNLESGIWNNFTLGLIARNVSRQLIIDFSITALNQSHLLMCLKSYHHCFADKIRELENECNCTMACHKVLYEPSLSYAILSEFNIDQVVLTDPSRKKAVKQQMEISMETQQRVVLEVKEQDEAIMGALTKTATDFQSAISTATNLFENTTILSATYGIVDTLNIDGISAVVRPWLLDA